MWKADEEFGHGICTMADGASYRGQWRRGTYCGLGSYKYTDDSVHEGLFKDGDGHGFGIFKDSDGQYEGNFKDDERHGFGVYKDLEDGSVFEGFWKDGISDGHGRLSFPDGSKVILCTPRLASKL